MAGFFLAAASFLAPMAAASQVDGLSLLQASAQPRDAATEPRDVLRVLERRRSTGHEVPSMESVKEQLAVLNETRDTVMNSIEQVNATVAQLFSKLNAALNSTIPELMKVKAAANVTPGGAGGVIIGKVCDILVAEIEKISLKSDAIEDRVMRKVETLLTKFSSFMDGLFRKMQAAVDKVTALSAEPQASLIAIRRGKGPMDWILGEDKFDKARMSVRFVNRTVARLAVKLAAVNMTATHLLLDNIAGTATDNLKRLQVQADVVLGASGIDPVVSSHLKALLGAGLGLIDTIAHEVSAAQGAIESQIINAESFIPKLYAASDSLIEIVDQAEMAAASAKR